MKKILLILAALVLFGCIGLLGLILLIGKLTAKEETYQEVQARLQREQESAQFWQNIVGVIVAVLALAILVIIWQVVVHFSHKRAMERLRFQEEKMRLNPDLLGNYPVRFDNSGNTIKMRPGNTNYQPTQNFIVGNSPVAPVARSDRQRDMPLAIYHNGKPKQQQEYSIKELEPEKLADPSPVKKVQKVQNLEPEIEAIEPGAEGAEPEPEPNYWELLAQAKRRGESKSKAIPAICNVPRNGKEPYLSWSRIWDEIPVEK